MKRVISLLLSVIMVLNMIPVSAFAAEIPRWNWEGYTPISTPEELAAIKDDMGGKYYLTQDITLSGNFDIIGGVNSSFTGIFDGNGHSIKNMTINTAFTATQTGMSVGLFSLNNGVIRNLTLNNANITATSQTANDGHFYVGMIAGTNNGEIINCKVLSGSTLTATVHSNGRVGGIAGRSAGTIKLCTNNGAIKVNSANYSFNRNKVYAGGIAGVGSNISYCVNNGAVTATGIGNENGAPYYVGGITGYADGSVNNCINKDAVTANAADWTAEVYIGGIAGYASPYATLTRCENSKDTSKSGAVTAKGGYVYAGGVVGMTDNADMDQCSNNAYITVYAKKRASDSMGYAVIGGLTGYAYGADISDCYVMGNSNMYLYEDTAEFYQIDGGFLAGQIADSTVTNFYTIETTLKYDNINATLWLGSLAGSVEDSALTNCLYENAFLNSTGSNNNTTFTNVTRVTAITNFRNQSTYTGFDFTDTWVIDPDVYVYASFKNPISHTHTKTAITGVAADCGQTGRINMWHCAECGTYFRNSSGTLVFLNEDATFVVPHDFSDWKTVTKATCTIDGSKTHSCKVCSYKETAAIPATGHTEGVPVIENISTPSCTTEGAQKETVYCVDCGAEISTVETVLPATGHTDDEAVVENHIKPTCTQDGSYDLVVYCTVCSTQVSRESKTDPYTGHSFTNYINNDDVTCTENGTKTARCDNCDATDTVAAEKLGHSFTNYVSNGDATCSAKGTETAKCDRCEVTDTRTDESTTGTHSFKDYVFNGDGTKTGTCEYCGEIKTVDVDILVYGPCGDNSYFTIYEDGRMCITGSGGVQYSTGWDNYRDYVTKLYFENYSDDNLSGFVADAFAGFVNLEKVEFTSAFPSLSDETGNYLFSDSAKLKTAGPVGSGCDIEYTWNRWIPYYAFANSPIESVIIADTVTEISYYAFYNCDNLTEIIIPESVITIGEYAFANSGNISKVIVPGSVTTMGEYVFDGCYGLETAGPVGSGCDIEFGWETSIPDHAFTGSQLKTITLPATITSIGTYAFDYCGNLTDIYYGGSKSQFESAYGGIIEYYTTVHYGMYDITVQSPVNGMVTVDKAVVLPGETVTITATADQCYAPDKIYVNGTEVTEYTFTAEKDSVVKVNFVISHTEEINPEVKPDCTNTGLTEGSYCSVCGEILVAQDEIPVLGHSFTNYIGNDDATCTLNGTETATCDRCDATDTREAENSKTDHVFENYTVITQATCTNYGYEEAKCENCNATDTRQVEMLPHTAEIIHAVDVTCLEDGWTEGERCTVCGEITVMPEIIESIGFHIPNLAGSTCTEDQICVECGELMQEKTGHLEGIKIKENIYYADDCLSYDSYEEVVQCAYCYETLSRVTVYGQRGSHDPIEKSGWEPTCTNPGMQTSVYCQICSEVLIEEVEIPALGHSYESSVTEGSCITDGFTTYTCMVCGDTYDDNIIRAPGHKYETVVTPPSCTDGGYTTYTCTSCEDTYQDDYTEPTDHIYDIVDIIPPSCESEGYTQYSCSVCGDWYNTDYLPETHVFTTHTVESTCQQQGYTVYTCESCGLVEYNDYTDMAAHDYETRETPSTCNEMGYTTYTCKNCQYSYKEYYTQLGQHKYTVIETIGKTCETDGYTQYNCEVCGDYYRTDIIPAGHDYQENIVPPTCDSEGYTEFTCDTCGDKYQDEFVPSAGHDYKQIVTPPTCTEDGCEQTICQNCGVVQSTETIPYTGHDYKTKVTAPTCEEQGWTTYRCENCGDEYNDNFTNPTGHNWNSGTVVKDPSCISAGEISYTCKNNDSHTYSESLPLAGHIPGQPIRENITTETCTTPGASIEYVYCTVCEKEISHTPVMIPAKGHTEEVVKGYNATCTQPGLTDGSSCKVCSAIINVQKTIPATGHIGIPVKGYAATCTQIGLTSGTVCSVCNTWVSKQQIIPLAEHTPGTPVQTSRTEPTCTEKGSYLEIIYCVLPECQAEISRTSKDIPAKGHTEKVIPAIAATCTTAGNTAGKECSVCGEILKAPENIPVTGHNFGDYISDGNGTMTRYCVNCDTKETITEPDMPDFDGVVRIRGSTRYRTAFSIADAMKGKLGIDKFSTVIVASGNGFADALAGSYLAKVKNAPILLASGSAANNAMLKQYLDANVIPGGKVYILGSEAAISYALDRALAGYDVQRVAGSTRYNTNMEILKEAGVTGGDIIVATGTNFADSLSASAVGLPILLLNGARGSLTDRHKAYLATLDIDDIYILGSEVAVNAALEEELKNYGRVERVAGSTRYSTSVEIAKKFFPNADSAIMAYALNYPDGLCGGPLAMVMDAPLILTKSNSQRYAKTYTDAKGITKGAILGSDSLIDDVTAEDIFNVDEIFVW